MLNKPGDRNLPKSTERVPKKPSKFSPSKPNCDDGFLCFDDDICEHMVLAYAYVKWQRYKKAFSPEEALQKGTLFPELWGVYPIPK